MAVISLSPQEKKYDRIKRININPRPWNDITKRIYIVSTVRFKTKTTELKVGHQPDQFKYNFNRGYNPGVLPTGIIRGPIWLKIRVFYWMAQ